MAKDDDDKPDAKDDDHSLDMSQAAVKRMIAEARERGHITYDQLNAVLLSLAIELAHGADLAAVVDDYFWCGLIFLLSLVIAG